MCGMALNDVVSLERQGDVAIIRIDNPPINAGSAAVRQGLLAAVREFDADPTLAGAILMGAGRTFMAGSDMKEFHAPVVEPHLTEIIDALQDSAKPVVAAIAGAALGGGYELSLGCDARIGAPDAVVGLPECLLGMMPGAGGTQRMTRLVGMEKSVVLICAGTRVKAAEAARIGMIDAVVEGDLLQAALVHLRGMGGKKRRAIELPLPPVDETALEEAKVKCLKAGRNRPNFRLAIESIENCRKLPSNEALAIERKVFLELRAGPEASALCYLFFAARDAAKRRENAADASDEAARFAIIGERLRAAFSRQRQSLVDKGAEAEVVDAALRDFGLDPKAFGSGDSAPPAHPSETPAVQGSTLSGELVAAVLTAMASEAAFLITENVAKAPSEIDLVLTTSQGLPRHEGGIVFWARNQPESQLRAAFQRLAAGNGGELRVGPLEALRATSTR
jgi:enoyl-CoA hydratase/carnithine racemase